MADAKVGPGLVEVAAGVVEQPGPARVTVVVME